MNVRFLLARARQFVADSTLLQLSVFVFNVELPREEARAARSVLRDGIGTERALLVPSLKNGEPMSTRGEDA